MSSRRCVLILAAGQGTRMKSSLPKVLHPLAGTPLVHHAVDTAIALQAAQIIVVVGYQSAQVEQSFANPRYEGKVTFAHQTEQKGTADAVRAGLPHIDPSIEEVLITYGDAPCVPVEALQSMIDQRARANSPCALLTFTLQDPTGYGRIVRDEQNRVCAIREHKECSEKELRINEVNAGMYAVKHSFLRTTLQHINASARTREFYLTDMIADAYEQGSVVAVQWAAEPLRGINDRAELAAAESYLLERIANQHRRNGVTIAPGARIEYRVTIEPDATIAQGAVLRGHTHIGAGATVDVGCVLDDAHIGAEALLKPYTIVQKSRVEQKAQLGPFAHLRPNSEVGEGAHVGNFVELKNTKMASGAKANHLAYLGDGDIAEGANIGAGTIFCNYDGFQKHRTTIQKNAFVGSNSSLVAPVIVGEGSYVGSGSVITKDVPPDALAVARAPQVNKEGYASKLRALKKKK